LASVEEEALKVRILFLDKEGGYGGSSRSLYFLIKNLDRSRVVPIVVLRERGPAMEFYRELGIRTILLEGFPVYKPSLRKNPWVLFLFLLRMGSFCSSCRLLSRLITENNIDIIHMNHDGFFVYGFFLRRFTVAKIIIHMRTMLPVNRYAALQARCIEKNADHLVFISENELQRYCELLGRRSDKSSVVFNSFDALSGGAEPYSSKGSFFKVLYLGNLTYNKGAYRLIDMALEMKARGIRNILFWVCGEDRGEKRGNSKGAMAFKAESAGVKPYFCFMGQQAEPERFLKGADVLIRLSRWNDPWGRDIIEAMAYGKPVIATGDYEGFIEHGVNGLLHSKYDAGKMVEDLVFLASHPEAVERMKKANIEKAKELFDGPSNAAKVAALYESILKAPRG